MARPTILDGGGNALPTGETGDVAVPGDDVMTEYAGDPEETVRAFAGSTAGSTPATSAGSTRTGF